MTATGTATTITDEVALAGDAYASFAAGDIPAVLALLDIDVIWHSPPGTPWGGDHHGREQMGAFFASLAGGVDEVSIEITRLDSAGSERVLAEGVEHYVIGGVAVDVPFAHVLAFRAGLVVEFTEYANVALLARAFGGKRR